jgi:hypothetical protein
VAYRDRKTIRIDVTQGDTWKGRLHYARDKHNEHVDVVAVVERGGAVHFFPAGVIDESGPEGPSNVGAVFREGHLCGPAKVADF